MRLPHMLPALVLMSTSPIAAQSPAGNGVSFEDARSRLDNVSDALAGSRANVRSKADLSTATRHLWWPDLSVDARGLRFRKTIDLPPNLGITTPAQFVVDDWRLRPTLSATLPLYTGGQIPAAQQAAGAAVRQAEAEQAMLSQSLTVRLVQAYFGQQLAQRALAVRKDVRDGLQEHLNHTESLAAQGFATKAQRLQATVARDQAERDYQEALNDLNTGQALLANLLHSTGLVRPTTALFVISAPLDSLETFQRDVPSRHPQVARLRAIRDQSNAAIRQQQAKLRPTAFVFGQYDLDKSDAFLSDPDWVVGAGVKYVLFTGSGRRSQVSAARQQTAQAEAGMRETETQLAVAVTSAYNDVETARRNYLLLESSIAQAEENVRLQDLSFREGQATSLDVIDARLALGRALIDRAQAAFRYDLTLAQLLDATGQTGQYADYIQRADKVLEQ